MIIDDIYKEFIAFAVDIGYPRAQIFRANQNNRNINPPCLVLAIQNSLPDSTNISDNEYNADEAQMTRSVSRIGTMSVIMDFYGNDALDWATISATAFEDYDSLGFFAGGSFVPIESTSPRALPFVGQDAMDYDRYQIICTINYNETYVRLVDFATDIAPETIRTA